MNTQNVNTAASESSERWGISPELKCHTSSELIPSISIERVIALRQEGIKVYMQGLEYLEQAKALFKDACQDESLYDFKDAVNEAVRWKTEDDKNIKRISKVIDQKIWDRLMEETGMYTFMSSKQREEWNKQLYSGAMPVITLDNVLATFRQLNTDKTDTFEQGVIDLFRTLSWDYKTNNPCKLGKKIIVKGVLNRWRSGNVSMDWSGKNRLDDLARPFYLLDGKNIPDCRVGEGSQYGEFFNKNGASDEAFESHYFNVRGYLNGNVHITFNQLELVDKINDIVARRYPAMLSERV